MVQTSSNDFDVALSDFAAKVQENLEVEEGYGRFTRAFVFAIFEHRKKDAGWNQLHRHLAASHDHKRAFARWLGSQLSLNSETDSDERLQMIRLAAQGASLHFGLKQRSQIIMEFERLHRVLVGLTAAESLDGDYW